MKELIKKSFELWCRTNWLKTIAREVDKRNKLVDKLYRQKYVVNKLVDEYCKKYNVDLKVFMEEGTETNEDA